jgi:hypothetical protein
VKPCPYNDPNCTGKHSGNDANKANMCPSAWVATLERVARHKRERRKTDPEYGRGGPYSQATDSHREANRRYAKSSKGRESDHKRGRKRREAAMNRAGRYDPQVITESICHLCHRGILPGQDTHVDHVIALNEPMPDGVVSGLRVAHAECNAHRGDKPISVFLLERLAG